MEDEKKEEKHNPMVGARVTLEAKEFIVELTNERKWKEAMTVRYLLYAAIEAVKEGKITV